MDCDSIYATLLGVLADFDENLRLKTKEIQSEAQKGCQYQHSQRYTDQKKVIR